MEIIDYIFKADNAVGISQLAKALDIPKATVFRILNTLEVANLVEKDYPSDNYKLGIGFVKYSAHVLSKISLVDSAKHILEEASKMVSESISLSIEHQDLSMNIYNVDFGNSNLVTKLIPISPLNCSATGNIFLSKRSKAGIADYFQSELPEKRTINSLMSADEHRIKNAFFSQNGYMIDDEEYEYGLYCIGVPLYHRGQIVAAISVSGPKTRIEQKGIKSIVATLEAASHKISQRISVADIKKLL